MFGRFNLLYLYLFVPSKRQEEGLQWLLPLLHYDTNFLIQAVSREAWCGLVLGQLQDVGSQSIHRELQVHQGAAHEDALLLGHHSRLQRLCSTRAGPVVRPQAGRNTALAISSRDLSRLHPRTGVSFAAEGTFC